VLTASTNPYQKTADDAAVALLRGATAKASAAADAAKADVKSDRGPATRTSLSPAAQAVAMLRSSLNALQPALDEDVVDALSEQLEKTSDALTKLDQAKQGMIGDRKAAAEQKLELARKKLALLRSLGGDPKTIARQAKAIAQEIKAAAIAYGEALKAEGAVGAAAGPVTDATGIAADPAASGDPAVAGDAPADSSSAKASATTDDTEAAASQDAPLPQTPAEKAEADAKAGQHDREVLEAFKDAAREVRRMMEEAARKLKARHDPDANATAQESRAMDKAVEELGEIIGNGQSGAADAATAITDIIVMPTIDIRV